MEQYKWDDDYNTGVEEIDAQHRHFFKLMVALVRHDAEDLARFYEELKRYTQFHFCSEEKLFELYDCPGQDEHKAEHRRLLEELDKKGAEIAAGNGSYLKTALFMLDWFVQHTTLTDKRMASHFKHDRIIP